MPIGTEFSAACTLRIFAPKFLRNLIRAEAIADRHTPGAHAPRVETLDYDGDGVDELLFTAPEYQALVKPSDGGTLAALDFRPTSSTLINSILRRPEPYHSRLRDPNYRPATSTASAYEQTKVKEDGPGALSRTTIAGRATPFGYFSLIRHALLPTTKLSSSTKIPDLPPEFSPWKTPRRKCRPHARWQCYVRPGANSAPAHRSKRSRSIFRSAPRLAAAR